jgi:uncharacterized CHY-type Zn-finger protein
MNDYISSLLIEPILRHARRFSQFPELSVSEDESVPPSPRNYDLDEPAQSTLLQLSIPSLQKLDNDDPHSVTRSALLDADLDCAQRRVVACRTSGFNDDLRRTMDDSQSQPVSGGEDTREPRSHLAMDNDTRNHTDGHSATGMVSTPSDAISDRYHSPKLRELPEDDGMADLRKRIHAIRDNGTSGIQKARLIHSLMIESYEAARATFSERPSSLSQSPPRARSRDSTASSPPRIRRLSIGSFDDFIEQSTVASVRAYYNVSPDDLEPTFAPKDIDVTTDNTEQSPVANIVPSSENDDNLSNSDYADEDAQVLGCPHYKRNVKLQCYTCKKWYTCRFCHNQNEDHALERQKTENMLCMLCGLPQPAAQWCKGCGERAASYFCAVCKLWDNDSSKSIYHCHDCGICRIGKGIGKDFYHCKV